MNGRMRWRGALLAGVVVLANNGCDLPTGGHGRTPLTLEYAGPDAVIVGDTAVLEVQAHDPTGRALLEPRLEWAFSADPDLPDPFEVLQTKNGRVWALGQYPATTRLTVRVPDSDPWFTSNVLTVDVPAHYGPIAVQFYNVGSDTLLTKRGPFRLDATAAVEKKVLPVYGTYEVTSRRGYVSVKSVAAGTLELNADSIGRDTLVLSNTACYDPCADTLLVRIEPVPAELGFDPNGRFYSVRLADTVHLYAVAFDSADYEIPGSPVTWRLVDPVDSAIIGMLDPSAGIVVSRGNGVARVAVESGSLEAETDFRVDQQTKEIRLWVPPHVVGVGTSFTATFEAFDAGGSRIPASYPVQPQWSADPAVLVASAYHEREVIWVTQTLGTSDVHLVVNSCPDVCSWVEAVGSVRVIPEPDSVRAYPQDGSSTVGGIGSTATWLGNIYLPDETLGAVPLSWTSLDPGVATIDKDGLVTAVAPGTARVVGSMGAAADTSVVTVTG